MTVQFEEENNFNRLYAEREQRSKSSGLTHWLIKKGFAKNESDANTLMIIIMIISFSLAIFFAIQ